MTMLGAYGLSLGDVSTKDRFVIDGLVVGDAPIWVGAGGIDLGSMDVARMVDQARPGRHGESSIGQDLLGARDITCPYVILAEGVDVEDNVELSGQALASLTRAWRPRNVDVPVIVQTRERAYVTSGRPRKMSRDRTRQRAGLITGMLLFRCGNPIMWDAAEPRVASCDVAPVGDGMGFPMGFPYGFGSGPSGCELANDGTCETWPTVTLTAGPSGMSAPTIVDRDSGLTFAMTGMLGAGWSYVIDMDAGQVALTNDPDDLSDAASRNNLVARPGSDWLSVPVGGSSWQFGCGSGSGTATVASRDAYL